MSATTFTVITPTRNAATHLEASIHAVALQRGDGLTVEHLLVDDGSVDETLAIAERHGLRVVSGRSRGLYDAMNLGVEMAEGELISVLGSGDLLLPGALRSVADGLASSHRRWAVGGVRWIDAEGRPLGEIAAPPAKMHTATYASLGWSCIPHQATFISRGLYDVLGGYDTSFRIAGDYELLARAIGIAPFHRATGTLAAFRRDGTNLSMAPEADAENARVADRYGPASLRERRLRGTALRVWLNGRNPSWAWEKQRARFS